VQFEVENNARKTLAEMIGGTVLLVGLYFTWSSVEVSREGQVTERFTRAIDQLGNKQLEIRLGGIYALERIARDSKKDHSPIMEILTAYVRQRVPWQPKDDPLWQGDQSAVEMPSAKNEPALPKPATDIQAILTVLGRRIRVSGQGEEQRFDLAGTDLRGANLTGTRLEGANFMGAHLEQASLDSAYLHWAILAGTHLEGANLSSARLKGAVLVTAHLEGVSFMGAHLEQANLQLARNLTVEQLCTVHTLYQAQLDPPLMEQVQQQCPQRLEEPPE
jgi:hypothetical protein